MKTIGFTKSLKLNERRRALLPRHLKHVLHVDRLIFEHGYASHFGLDDLAYVACGVTVASREEVMKAEVICCPKAPEPQEMAEYRDGQIFFGWAHAVQGRRFVDFSLSKSLTVIAWEDMYEDGRHSFWENNQLAGEAAALQALPYLGRSPHGLSAAIIGIGNCGHGAFAILNRLGVRCEVFSRSKAAQLRGRLQEFDIVVNAVLWDVFRSDHLIDAEDIARMRRPSMIIDVSCDEGMGIETSRATSVDNPVYEVGGVTYYAVDHTPTILFRTATEKIGWVVSRFIDDLVEGRPNACLENATCIEAGKIRDPRIVRYQNR